MRDPARLEVLVRATDLAVLTYKATATFGLREPKGLGSQMRRAAASVGSNIAEGCGRSTERSFMSFLQIAAGSVAELAFQTELAIRLEAGDPQALQEVLAMSRRVKAMLAKLQRSIRASSTLH
jgi:four helix bundle protein